MEIHEPNRVNKEDNGSRGRTAKPQVVNNVDSDTIEWNRRIDADWCRQDR